MLKSCKGTGRASLPGSPPSEAAGDATLGPRVQRLADTVDEFQLDCKSDLKFHEWSFRLVTPQDHQQAGKCEANASRLGELFPDGQCRPELQSDGFLRGENSSSLAAPAGRTAGPRSVHF